MNNFFDERKKKEFKSITNEINKKDRPKKKIVKKRRANASNSKEAKTNTKMYKRKFYKQ